jgi:parallel beta-helix repeat protein
MRRFAGTLVALLLAFFALAGSANAVDGVLEINPSCIATGCFAGDSPGFPVTISAPGSYRLTGSLDVRNANTFAIRVSVDVHDVAIDLNGFTIAGPTVCSGFPMTCAPGGAGMAIDAQGSFRVSVRNGVLRGFAHAGLLSSAQARVIDVFATSNGQAGLVVGTGSVIERSVVFENGGRGIDCNHCVVRGNTVRGNVLEGIHASSGSLIESNSVTSNGGVGLSLAIGGSGYLQNVLSDNNGGNANPQVSGGIELGKNLCGLDAICP